MEYLFDFGSPHPSAIHGLPATDSTRKRYFVIASLANLLLRGNFCAIVVKVRLRNTSARSEDIAEFSRKNGSKSNAHRYDKDRKYSCWGEFGGKEAY